MTASRRLVAMLMLACAMLLAPAAARANHIAARLAASGPVEPGKPLTVAIAFDPAPGWHGYWKNPGDAGYGLTLAWRLPPGWSAGEPQYPVPQKLVIGGLMNHVYEGPYTVLVDMAVPADMPLPAGATVAVDAQWLACTDTICVPEQARLTLDPGSARADPAFARWRAAIPALLDRRVTWDIADGKLRVAIPLPAAVALPDPHLFITPTDLVDYAAPQAFSRDGDTLIAEVPLGRTVDRDKAFGAILSLGDGNGIRLAGDMGPVPAAGTPLRTAGGGAGGPLWVLLLGALAGGLLLNVMPCVFPILSLKALSLARAGESDAKARSECIAYTAGVVLATLALGGLLLVLRAAGEEVGWAFQLQQPAVVVALLALALAITANLAGLFEIPSLSVSRGGQPAGAFGTGLLAAFVATPCTGPFMAAAMGAALLLPWAEGLLLFGALGLGLALPFLLLGFVPPLRRILPKPGRWMDTFRKVMAVPMGLTALALLWLCWRLGGVPFAIGALAIAAAATAMVVWAMRVRESGRSYGYLLAFGLLFVAMLGAQILPTLFRTQMSEADEGLLAARPFTEARLAEARAAGKPVFLWFTADWCLTCKVNERTAIEREATRDAFERAGVVALVGDWTRRDPAITRFLSAQGAAGVPLYLWYAPGRAAQTLPQVLTPGTLVSLADRAGADRSPVLPQTAARSPRAMPAGGSAR